SSPDSARATSPATAVANAPSRTGPVATASSRSAASSSSRIPCGLRIARVRHSRRAHVVVRLGSVRMTRIALVTGANQGLGRALAAGLAPHVERVVLSGRDPERVAAGAAELGVEGRVLDVRDGAAIDALAAELGEVDIVFSNATARMSPDAEP